MTSLPPFPAEASAYTRAVQDYFLRSDPATGVHVKDAAQARELGLKYSSTFVYPNLQSYPDQTLAFLSYLDRLDVKTAERLSSSAAKFYGAQIAQALVPLLIPLVQLGYFDDLGPTRQNIVAAFGRWQERKASYREIVEAWKAADADPFAKTAARSAYATDVAGPLYLGWFPGAGQQSVIDAVTPIVIAKMVGVAQAAMSEAWARLGRDLTLADVRDGLRPALWPAWAPWVAGGVGAVALGGLGYLVLRRPRRPVSAPDDRGSHGRAPGAGAVCGAPYGRLSEATRDRLPSSAFGLPGARAYPMPDVSHARNAKSRAAGELARWKETNGARGISPAQFRQVTDMADRIIERCQTDAG